MKPYWSDDTCALYLGDCREITEWLAADVLVIDPPYGIAWSRRARRRPGHGSSANTGIAGDADTSVRDAVLAIWGSRPGIAACPPGVIADPFAGSGSTLVAARNLGRRAIGVEIDERYAEQAARRLAQQPLEVRT